MGKVILDAETRAKLNGLDRELELYDDRGNLLGHFVPLPVSPAGSGGWGPFTAEEVEAALNQTDPGRPLADILADLRRRHP